MYLAVSIDTECDKGKQWRIKRPMSFRGVYQGVGEYLQPLFDRLGIKPTYLLSPEVIRDEKSLEIFRDISLRCELGTHLHGEFVEPGANFNTDYTGEKSTDYGHNVEFEKLRNLTDIFSESFGFRPRSYRAGRFSISKRTFKFLERLGYSVDTSFTPFSRVSGVDHTGVPFYPHFPYNSILEIPITIFPKNWKLFNILRKTPLYGWRRYREFVKLIGPVWLRPSTEKWKRMLWLAKKYINMFGDKTVLNMFLHNVEVVEGLSPYSAKFTRKNLESILPALLDMGFKPATLYDIYNIYSNADTPP